MWARIDGDRVAEITDIDPAGRYHPSIQWELASNGAEEGDIFDGSGFSKPEGPAISDLASLAMARINSDYQAEMNEILRDYPEAETLTWDKQEEEARRWAADSSASTPLLDAIAQGRDMDKDELVSRVLAKADAWIAASGLSTGKRQALEDEINEAIKSEDREKLEVIAW